MAIPGERKLSPHFRWREFAMPDGTLPPDAHWTALKRLCEKYLEPLRRAYGPVIVTSGYRSARHNHAVGGAPASRHVPGNEAGVAAADVYARSGSPREWARALDELGAGGVGTYATHVHVDTRAARARW